jgi:hypothetical protein
MIGSRFVLLVPLVIFAIGCHRIRDEVVLVGSDPKAPPLPLELLFCASGKSVEVEETGTIILVAGRDVRYGLVSRERLDTLLALLASEQYLADLRLAEQQPGPNGCMEDPSVFIIYKARRQQYRFVLGEDTPPAINSLLQIVHSLAVEGYGPGYDPFASSEHGVKPNPRFQAAVGDTGFILDRAVSFAHRA